MELDANSDEHGRSVTELVVDCLADATGRDPLELPPLWEVIDPEGLNSVFEPRRSGDERAGTVQFRYCGHEVTVETQSSVIVSAKRVSTGLR